MRYLQRIQLNAVISQQSPPCVTPFDTRATVAPALPGARQCPQNQHIAKPTLGPKVKQTEHSDSPRPTG